MLARLLASTAILSLALSPAAALTLQQLTPQNQNPVPNPDGYQQNQLLRLPPSTMGIGATVGGALIAPRVLNAAQAAKLLPGLGHFHRAGFATAGDGGEADYMTTSTPCSLNNGAGDGGSQIGLTGPVGSSYIGCANADFGDKPPSVTIWGAVADSNGTPGNGTDDTAAFQAALNWANPQARKVYVPGGAKMYRLTSTLQAPGNGTIQGDGVDPGSFVGSTLFFDHTGIGITYAGEWYFKSFGTFRAQPAPSATAGVAWTPCACDYDFYQVAGEGHMDDMFLINATKELYISTGRGQFSLQGQVFQVGINVAAALDTVSIRQTRHYPYWSANQNVTNYTQANAIGILGARFDNPEIVDYFGIVLNNCMRLVTGSAAYAPATTSRMNVTNFGCDNPGGPAVNLVGATAVTAMFTNLYAAPGSTNTGAGLINIDANSNGNNLQVVNSRSSGNGTAPSGGGSAIVVQGSGNTITTTNFRVDGWGSAGDGSAISVAFGNMVYDNDLVPDFSGGPTSTSPYFGGTAFQIAQGGYLKLLNGSGSYELALNGANANVAVGGGATNMGENVGNVFQNFAAGAPTGNLGSSPSGLLGSTSSGKIGIGYATDQNGYILTNNTGAAVTVFYRFHRSYAAN